MSASDRVQVPDSERQLEPGHSRVGDVDSQAEIDVTVYVRPRAALDWVDKEAAPPLAQRRVCGREEWAQKYGARPADIDSVKAFAEQHGLADHERRSRPPSSPSARHPGGGQSAFQPQLEGLFSSGEGAPSYRGRTGPLTVPAQLDRVVTAVLGIDDRPQAAKLPGARPAGPQRDRGARRRRLQSPGTDTGADT